MKIQPLIGIYNDKLVKILDKSSDINKEKVYAQINIYYSEKYGISRGFTAMDTVFSVISICFIFFGVVAISFKKTKIILI